MNEVSLHYLLKNMRKRKKEDELKSKIVENEEKTKNIGNESKDNKVVENKVNEKKTVKKEEVKDEVKENKIENPVENKVVAKKLNEILMNNRFFAHHNEETVQEELKEDKVVENEVKEETMEGKEMNNNIKFGDNGLIKESEIKKPSDGFIESPEILEEVKKTKKRGRPSKKDKEAKK